MYKLTATNDILRVSDGALIPRDPGNLDYRAVQDWLDAGGVLEPTPAPVFNQGAALQRAREMRKPILDALVGIGLQAFVGGDNATTAACLTARQGLLDITKDAGVLAATSDSGFDAAVLARYHQLVAGAPVAVLRAFTESAT